MVTVDLTEPRAIHILDNVRQRVAAWGDTERTLLRALDAVRAANLLVGSGPGAMGAEFRPIGWRVLRLNEISEEEAFWIIGDVRGDVLALETALAAEGYTLLLSTSSTHSIGPNLNPRMPYDAVRDFTPIAHLGNAPSIMLVPNNSPAKTVKEWIDYAKKNPGRLNYASSGNGTIVQLSAELFKAQADVFVVHIPYKGTALAIPDLITGKVDVLFDSLPTGMPHVRDGRLRALGVTTLKPTALAPGIPAIADVLPGYESNTWFGLFGSKGLPPEVVSRVNTAANQVLQDPEVMDKLQRFGIEPVGGTPAQFTTMLASESAKWKKIINERKITLD